MVDFTDRRRFLQLAGTGAAASIAGCADLNPMADSDDPHADKVTAFVEPDMGDLQQLQEDLMGGEIGENEVQDELLTLHEEAISSFEAFVDDDDGLVIEESERVPGQMGEETGLYLLDGEPESIIGALQGGVVSQLLSGPTFDMVLEQQEQQQQQQEQMPEEGAAPPEEGEEPSEEEIEIEDDDIEFEDDGEDDE